MRAPFRTLLGQLTIVLLVIAATVSVVTGAFFVLNFWEFTEVIDQRTHAQVAELLSRDLATSAAPEAHVARILEELRRIKERNPYYDLYVVDESGRILANSPLRLGPKRNAVDLAPIREWMSGDDVRRSELRGDDPSSRKRRAPFSVAPFNFRGRPGYLYVVVKGNSFLYAASVFGESRLYGILAALFVAIVLIVTLVGGILFFLIIRRLGRMTRILTLYAAGDYGLRIDDARNDELGFHARAFNTMADRIEDALGALKKSEANRRELVAQVSHDLRTPVAAARGLVESSLEHYERLSDAEHKSLLSSAVGSLAQLGKLIGDLFELSKLDAEMKTPVVEPFSASELSQDVASKMRGIAEAKGIFLAVDIPHSLAMVRGDIGMIERVLTNLLTNAIQHTLPGRGITLRIAADGPSYRFEVRDEGIGIPESELPFIFEKFYRGGRSASDGGAGLGLAIVKTFVALHGAEIRVTSVEGRGTRFWFLLPAASD